MSEVIFWGAALFTIASAFLWGLGVGHRAARRRGVRRPSIELPLGAGVVDEARRVLFNRERELEQLRARLPKQGRSSHEAENHKRLEDDYLRAMERSWRLLHNSEAVLLALVEETFPDLVTVRRVELDREEAIRKAIRRLPDARWRDVA